MVNTPSLNQRDSIGYLEGFTISLMLLYVGLGNQLPIASKVQMLEQEIISPRFKRSVMTEKRGRKAEQGGTKVGIQQSKYRYAKLMKLLYTQVLVIGSVYTLLLERIRWDEDLYDGELPNFSPHVPYANDDTKEKIVTNIVHTMFVNPEQHRRTRARHECVKYGESFFRSAKAYQVAMYLVRQLGNTWEKRSKKLIEEAMKVKYKKYDLTTEAFDQQWKASYKSTIF